MYQSQETIFERLIVVDVTQGKNVLFVAPAV